MSLAVSLFFFSAQTSPPLLHSFPTRRSSDLVVLVHYKSPAVLLECLRTLAPELAPLTSEIVVVDNDSQDGTPDIDRKSTRLNSSHVEISYAAFCLKKKKTA